ncbi:PIR protein [Plasmodium vivax]|uniref:VIR protein n=1 Tax=Plasmodium vivax TaxID=5855 RepID=A0A565A5K0_PLAVI|nr:PIR protein [Plasmodium vivax]
MVDLGLKEAYPFLERIWKKYSYDEDVVESNNNVGILSLCNKDTLYENNPSDDKKNACKKLLKNFELLHINKRTYIDHDERCKNLNNWIYYEINPYKLTDAIVYNILKEAQFEINKLPNDIYCKYNAVEKEVHLEKLIKLRIFNDNTETFLSILKKESDPDYCSCQKFLEDCVNIYGVVKHLSCSIQGKRTNSEDMCNVITQFPIFYAYLTREHTIVKKIPDLYTGIREEELNCQSTVETLEAQPSVDSLSDARIQKTDSTASAVPTALGTVAGASSVLALLYKFTPAGRFLISGLRKSGGRINNGLNEGYPSELGFDGMEHNLINSYNIGYEAA